MAKLLIRLIIIAAGLISAASLFVLMFVLLIVWALRALWLKLTGQAAQPFVMRMNPREGFDQVFKRAEQPKQRRTVDDVTDVEPKR